MNRKTRVAGGAALLAVSFGLAGCFGGGEPSEAEMLFAIKRNDQLHVRFGGLASGLPGFRGGGNDLLANASIRKDGCTAAQGAPGFVCDFRIGVKQPDGKVEYEPSSAKARFFKSGDEWKADIAS